MSELITKNKTIFLLNFTQKETSEANSSKVLHAISVADSLLNEHEKESSISKGISILSEILESNLANNAKNFISIIFSKCIECFNRTNNQTKCILIFFFKKFQEKFLRLFVNRKTVQDLPFQVYASHSLTRFYYLELIKILPNLILHKLELIHSLIDLLTKENTLVEEKLLILEIIEDNFNKDSNISKAFAENFNYFVANFLEAAICKEDKIKILLKLFKILNLIAIDKNDFSVECQIVLRDFLYKFTDKDQISYKLISYAFKILRNTNSSLSFDDYLTGFIEMISLQFDSSIHKIHFNNDEIDLEIKKGFDLEANSIKFFEDLVWLYFERKEDFSFKGLNEKKIILKLIYGFIDFLYFLDYSCKENIDFLLKTFVSFDQLNIKFYVDSSSSSKTNFLFELFPLEKFRKFKVFDVMRLINIEVFQAKLKKKFAEAEEEMEKEKQKSFQLNKIKTFNFNDFLINKRNKAALNFIDYIINENTNSLVAKENNNEDILNQEDLGISDSYLSNLSEFNSFFDSFEIMLNIVKLNLNKCENYFEFGNSSVFYLLSFNKDLITSKFEMFTEKLKENEFYSKYFTKNTLILLRILEAFLDLIYQFIAIKSNGNRSIFEIEELIENCSEILNNLLYFIFKGFKIKLDIINDEINIQDIKTLYSILILLGKFIKHNNNIKQKNLIAIYSKISKAFSEFSFLNKINEAIKLNIFNKPDFKISEIKKTFNLLYDITQLWQEIQENLTCLNLMNPHKSEENQTFKITDLVDFYWSTSSCQNTDYNLNKRIYFSYILFKKILNAKYNSNYACLDDFDSNNKNNFFEINTFLNNLRNIIKENYETLKNSEEFLKEFILYMENLDCIYKNIFNVINFKLEQIADLSINISNSNFSLADLMEKFNLKKLNFFELENSLEKFNKLGLLKEKLNEIKLTEASEYEDDEESISAYNTNNNKLISDEKIDFIKNFLKIKKSFFYLEAIILILNKFEINLLQGINTNINNNNNNNNNNENKIDSNILACLFAEIKKNILNIFKSFEKIFSNTNIASILFKNKTLFEEMLNLFIKISSILDLKSKENSTAESEEAFNLGMLSIFILLKNNFFNKEKYFSVKINEIILFLFADLFNDRQEDAVFDLKINKKTVSEEEVNFNLTLKTAFFKKQENEKSAKLQISKIDYAEKKENDKNGFYDLFEDKSYKFFCIIYLDEKEYFKVCLNDNSENILAKKEVLIKIKSVYDAVIVGNQTKAISQKPMLSPKIKDLGNKFNFKLQVGFYVSFRESLHIKLKNIEKLLN